MQTAIMQTAANQGREATCRTKQAWEEAVKHCTTRALARYPEETARILRGMALVIEDSVHVTPEGVQVDSQTHEGRQYPVNGMCACYDATRAPEGRCKHRWAKALYTKAFQAASAQPIPRLHYYATYYPLLTDVGGVHGTAVCEDGQYTFVGDEGSIVRDVGLAHLALGGRLDLIQEQQAVDGASLGAKFGQPQLPQY